MYSKIVFEKIIHLILTIKGVGLYKQSSNVGPAAGNPKIADSVGSMVRIKVVLKEFRFYRCKFGIPISNENRRPVSTAKQRCLIVKFCCEKI